MRVRWLILMVTTLVVMSACGGGAGDEDGDDRDTNTNPVADAGPDRIVDIGSLVTLDGSGSRDADGNRLTYSWVFASKPPGSTATLTFSKIVNPSFTADLGGSYVLSLIVNDGRTNSAADTVILRALGPTYSNSLGMTFNSLPAGTFTMGSPDGSTEYPVGSGNYPAWELGRYADEIPHQVTLSQSFYIQTTEVTQAQWQAVMGSNPSYFSSCGNDCPVDSVSWNQIQTFLFRLNAMGEGTYRLPTEAEWEYAARAGSTTAFANGGITVSFCTNDANLVAMGWYCFNANSTTLSVAQKLDNSWDLYDMHGNVLEWVQDWYGSYPNSAVIDPTGPGSGTDRVNRGGSWDGSALEARSAYRSYHSPDYSSSRIGFRLVLPRGQ
ncbi:SUMF1/EgtB/PvdO family nonheme iron enzyme [Thermodesulfobacteriota bacterium]